MRISLSNFLIGLHFGYMLNSLSDLEIVQSFAIVL